MYREGKASEFDRPRKILGSLKFNVVSWRNALKVCDEIVLWSRRITEQGCAKQPTVSLLDGYAERGRLASKLSHYRGFKVAYEELGHHK